MTRFHFRLQKVLEWREKQLELEEVRFKQSIAELAGLEKARSEITAAETGAETELRKSAAVSGQDLAALAGYRRFAQARLRQLAAARIEAEKRLAAQQKTMLEARRLCRLLESLKERRLADWQAALDKEVDELAAESHLAKWSGARERTRPSSG